MSKYLMYKQAKDAINQAIIDKETDIATIKNDIAALKKTRWILDEEFKINMEKKEKYIG